jgi:hypothetical protein
MSRENSNDVARIAAMTQVGFLGNDEQDHKLIIANPDIKAEEERVTAVLAAIFNIITKKPPAGFANHYAVSKTHHDYTLLQDDICRELRDAGMNDDEIDEISKGRRVYDPNSIDSYGDLAALHTMYRLNFNQGGDTKDFPGGYFNDGGADRKIVKSIITEAFGESGYRQHDNEGEVDDFLKLMDDYYDPNKTLEFKTAEFQKFFYQTSWRAAGFKDNIIESQNIIRDDREALKSISDLDPENYHLFFHPAFKNATIKKDQDNLDPVTGVALDYLDQDGDPLSPPGGANVTKYNELTLNFSDSAEAIKFNDSLRRANIKKVNVPDQDDTNDATSRKVTIRFLGSVSGLIDAIRNSEILEEESKTKLAERKDSSSKAFFSVLAVPLAIPAAIVAAGAGIAYAASRHLNIPVVKEVSGSLLRSCLKMASKTVRFFKGDAESGFADKCEEYYNNIKRDEKQLSQTESKFFIKTFRKITSPIIATTLGFVGTVSKAVGTIPHFFGDYLNGLGDVLRKVGRDNIKRGGWRSILGGISYAASLIPRVPAFFCKVAGTALDIASSILLEPARGYSDDFESFANGVDRICGQRLRFGKFRSLDPTFKAANKIGEFMKSTPTAQNASVEDLALELLKKKHDLSFVSLEGRNKIQDGAVNNNERKFAKLLSVTVDRKKYQIYGDISGGKVIARDAKGNYFNLKDDGLSKVSEGYPAALTAKLKKELHKEITAEKSKKGGKLTMEENVAFDRLTQEQKDQMIAPAIKSSGKKMSDGTHQVKTDAFSRTGGRVSLAVNEDGKGLQHRDGLGRARDISGSTTARDLLEKVTLTDAQRSQLVPSASPGSTRALQVKSGRTVSEFIAGANVVR